MTRYLVLLCERGDLDLDLVSFSATRVTSGSGVVNVPREDSPLDGLDNGDVGETIDDEGLDVFITKQLLPRLSSAKHFLKCFNKI